MWKCEIQSEFSEHERKIAENSEGLKVSLSAEVGDETQREPNHMLFYWGWILLFIQFHGIITAFQQKVTKTKTRERNDARNEQ